MLEHGMDQTIEREKTAERVRTLGSLKNFGIGNPNGIPTRLAGVSEAEMREHDQALVESIADVTDSSCDCCIDGRHKKSNADGSGAVVREQFVGGSAANLGVAMNAGSSVMDTIPEGASIGEMIATVDEYVARASGKGRSAHLGGCGGANGEIQDNELIAHNANIMAATKGILSDAEVAEFFQLPDQEVSFTDAHYDTVRERSAKTAELEGLAGWDGKKYVEGVTKEKPGNVEDLEADDSQFHGHDEQSIAFYIGKDGTTISKSDEFVVNGNAIRKKALALAGQRGVDGYVEAVIASVAKHVATSHRLASEDTPFKIVK